MLSIDTQALWGTVQEWEPAIRASVRAEAEEIPDHLADDPEAVAAIRQDWARTGSVDELAAALGREMLSSHPACADLRERIQARRAARQDGIGIRPATDEDVLLDAEQGAVHGAVLSMVRWIAERVRASATA